jgi:Asp-tRNA(Asn)/Glu-tRNA(Gln) amidotransferase A subunit family amidase
LQASENGGGMNSDAKPGLEVAELTIEAACAAFDSGSLTAEELTRASLERIAKYNPQYNAIIFQNPDALANARAIDRRRATGESLGSLAGIPVVVKDTIDMAGIPTTGGWWLLHAKKGGVDLLPATDAPVVARLRAAGAVILGKTNVPVLSHTGTHASDSWAGPTFNAAGRAFMPGGSSAGTATAVAASFALVGLGEETGGSIQNPASAQGLVGVKPTFGLVPTAGVMPLSGLRDVVGPIARTVRDAALTLDVLAGYSPEDPRSSAGIGHKPQGGYATQLACDALRGKRIGTYGPGWRDAPLCAETALLYARARQELEARGAVIVEDPFRKSGFAAIRECTPPLPDYDGRGLESVPYDLQKYLERLGPQAAITSFAQFAAATTQENAFGPKGVLHYLSNLPDFAPCFAAPTAPPAQPQFVAAKERYLRVVEAVFERERLDALMFPQMRREVPALHSSDAIATTTVCEINIAGLPGVTVPAGLYRSGAPFGLIFVGRLWSEADLLACAYDYERATQHRRPPHLSEG